MNAGRLPVSRAMVSTVLRQTSNLTPCAMRLSTRWRLGFFGAEQVDAGTERHHLDRDLVGIVSLQQVVGDADHQAFLLRIVVGKLQREAMFGERLVRQWRRLRAAAGDEQHRTTARKRRRIQRAWVDKSHHPCPAMPGLSATSFNRDAVSALVRHFPRPQCLANTSHTGAPFCSLTEAHPATL